jgi:hypothetical protein
MIKIAHRGNTNGPRPEIENNPAYLLGAINDGFDVEADVWRIGDHLYFGHDEPKYPVSEEFILSIGLNSWFHCKNLEALHFFNTVFPQLNYFWHQGDDYTLTSQGYIWTYPGKETTHRSVIVDLSKNPDTFTPAFAICSDYLQ